MMHLNVRLIPEHENESIESSSHSDGDSDDLINRCNFLGTIKCSVVVVVVVVVDTGRANYRHKRIRLWSS